MAEQEDHAEEQKKECPPPPLDHLRPSESAPIAIGASDEGSTIDRKKGNPGPQVKPFGISDQDVLPGKLQQASAEEPYSAPQPQPAEDAWQPQAEIPKPKEEEVKDGKCTPEEEVIVKQALGDLKEIFPTFKEDWLRRCIIQFVIKQKNNLDQAVSWIYDYENLAPRKEMVITKISALARIEDYDMAKSMFKKLKHDATEEYKYFSEVKLTQKFPQFSIYSLRQTLEDFDYMYPLTVVSIVEGLERLMQKDQRTWKDWNRNELVYISMQKPSDGKWYKYPLSVVKGQKFWCKKKARMTVFPGVLAQEIRLVEQALVKYEERMHELKAKRDAMEAYQQELEAAIIAGYALECPICMEKYLPQEQVNCTAGHEFCLKCLQGSVREAVAGQLMLTSQGQLPCIGSSCEGVFPLVMLCHMLPAELMALFEDRLWTDFLAKANIPNLHRCPTCGYAEEVEAPVEVLKLFTCNNPRCGFKSCRECRNAWEGHQGRPCKDMQMDPEEALKKKYEEMMNEVTIRRCISCKRPQTKTEGCNKLTCLCGAKMCYLCRKPIEAYDHFCQHGRDPGEKCPCGKCELFLEPEGLDEKIREKLQMQLQEELLELKLNLEKKTQVAAAKTAGVIEATPQPQDAQPNPLVAPQQRMFAAVFG